MGGKPKFKSAAQAVKQEAKVAPKEEVGAIDLPNNWPEDITFLSDQTYTTAALELQPRLSRAPSDNSQDPWSKVPPSLIRSVTPHVKVVTIQDPKHPAHGQRGLFAAEHLVPDRFIMLYVGLVHTNSLSDIDPDSDYDLSLDRDIGLSVDASRMGNESRCANDYRGVAERPNAEFRDCYIQVPSGKRVDGVRWERRVGIFVLSAGKAGKRKAGIRANEEILVSYGKGFWEGRQLLDTFRKDAETANVATQAL